jgi:eukaryotic-like serine/threonine-protein kinase
VERAYELVRRIAGGGMGEVFVARLTGAGSFEKQVALKLLLPHLADDPELVQGFHDEARLAARMHHPNIVEIFDVGETGGRPFIAMQLVDGVTTHQLIRDAWNLNEPIPLPIARFIAVGLCEALHYAHALTDGEGRALKVVHRDVTPGNVLVSRNGAVLLTDFGIARVRDGTKTAPGVVRGKAAYLAPEQVLLDAPVDARADIYSAGLTLYEILTGTNPHRRETNEKALLAVAEGEIARIETRRADLTPGLANAIHRALARRPEERFATAKAMREALVDGPIATGHELADFVHRICPATVAVAQADALVAGTRSVKVDVATRPDRAAMTPSNRVTKLARPLRIAEERSTDPERDAVAPRPSPGGPTPARWSVAAPTEPEHARSDRSTELGAQAVSRKLGRTEALAVQPSPLPWRVVTVLAVIAAGLALWLVVRPEPSKQKPLPVVRPVTPEPEPVKVAPEPPVIAAVVVAPDPTPTPEPVRAPVAARHPVAPVKSSPVHVGFLTADATPWAEVLVGGRVIERTPFVRYPLPVGKYTLVFRGPDGSTREKIVSLAEGEVTAVRVEF